MDLEDIELTESEINLDEFSSIGSYSQVGGKCGICRKDGHNRRSCPDAPPKTETPKPKTTKTKTKVTKPSKKRVVKRKKTVKTSSTATHSDLGELLVVIKSVLFKIICSAGSVTSLDLGGFKIPRGGLHVADFNYNSLDKQHIHEACKIKSYTAYSNTRESDVVKFNLVTDDLQVLNKPNTREKRLKAVKSFVFPLASSKFIRGSKYGGLTTIDNNPELMRYVGALEKSHNLKRLVQNSKRDWIAIKRGSRDGETPKDPLYYHFVILEGVRVRGKETAAPVLGYIRLMRESVLHDEIMLRIVIREEGRGIGKKSLYEAIDMMYNNLKDIYPRERLNNFTVVAETLVENKLGAGAFSKWGFYKEDGGFQGVFKKPYGDVYRFTLQLNETLKILNPDRKSYKIPSINRLKHLRQPKFDRYNIVYAFNCLEDGFKTENAARNVFRNITNSLAHHGLFLTITKDSINILKRITGNTGEFGNTLYKIIYNSMNVSDNFGIRYKISSDKTHTEYLVKNEVFKTIAGEYELQEVYTTTLDKFYETTRSIPLFVDLYSSVKMTPELTEILSLLRVSVFVHTKQLEITGLLPENKTVVKEKRTKKTMTGGKNPILTPDKIIEMMRDVSPRIYYKRDEEDRGVREATIRKIVGDKIIAIDDETDISFPLHIDTLRYLNRGELKRWGRGPKNFRFVTRDIDLNVSGDRDKCIYLDNSNALWETVKNIDSWEPFVFRNDPDENFVILHDKRPKARYHFLVVPKAKKTFKELTESDGRMLAEMQNLALQNIRNNFINTRFKIGFMRGGGKQTQLHLHVISSDVRREFKSKFSKPNFISVNSLISSLKH